MQPIAKFRSAFVLFAGHRLAEFACQTVPHRSAIDKVSRVRGMPTNMDRRARLSARDHCAERVFEMSIAKWATDKARLAHGRHRGATGGACVGGARCCRLHLLQKFPHDERWTSRRWQDVPALLSVLGAQMHFGLDTRMHDGLVHHGRVRAAVAGSFHRD
jgi:hypothetical protein